MFLKLESSAFLLLADLRTVDLFDTSLFPQIVLIIRAICLKVILDRQL